MLAGTGVLADERWGTCQCLCQAASLSNSTAKEMPDPGMSLGVCKYIFGLAMPWKCISIDFIKAGILPELLNKHFGIPSLIVEINAKIPVGFKGSRMEISVPKRHGGIFISWAGGSRGRVRNQDLQGAGSWVSEPSVFSHHWRHGEPGLSLVLKKFSLLRCVVKQSGCNSLHWAGKPLQWSTCPNSCLLQSFLSDSPACGTFHVLQQWQAKNKHRLAEKEIPCVREGNTFC